MQRRISTPFFLMITTIGDAHGDVDGWTILAASSPLMRSDNFSRYLGATGRTLCAIGAAPPTSISQIAPRAAGGEGVTFTHEEVTALPDQQSEPLLISGERHIGIADLNVLNRNFFCSRRHFW